MSESRAYVRLKIISDAITPEQISASVGINPTKSWRVGDRREPTIVHENDNGWVLESDLPHEAPLEAHVESLLARLAPLSGEIEALAEVTAVEFSCVVYAKETPTLYFEKSWLRQIVKLGASLDIDLYLGG
jgi:hypothetical protein